MAGRAVVVTGVGADVFFDQSIVRTVHVMSSHAKPKLTWLLFPISLGAFLATWGGWAKLSTMTGYAEVQMLPGYSGSELNIGIALPITVEPFGMLATTVAFNPRVKGWARAVAGVMALATLIAAGICQAVVHHLTVTGQAVAPAGIVAVTSVLPVAVLGLGAGLAVLNSVRRDDGGTSHGTASGTSGTRFLGRLGTALGDAVASQAERLAETSRVSRDSVGTVSQLPIPTSPAPAGLRIPAVQQLDTRKLEVVRSAPLERDPEVLDQVARWLAEEPKPTVEQIASRLGTSRSTAGRISQAARKVAAS